MKILNLTNINASQIEYRINSYPDGQQDVLLHPSDVVCSTINEFPESVKIKSRFNSFRDLELIICATKALRRLKVKEIHLYIPYLLGSRSDRQFQEGGTSYLVDVIAPIINSLNFESVTVLDVHQPSVTAACINNLINKSIELFKPKHTEIVLVSPDAGAIGRTTEYAKKIGYKGEILTATKKRDLDGKITHTEIPINMIHVKKDFIIIDDICDGGRTFIELAKVIKKNYPKSYIILVVTHGIFSAGLKELSEYFDHIYTTNSIMDINSSTEFGMRNERYLSKITQYKI